MGSLSAVAFLLVLMFLPEMGIHKEKWAKRAPVGSVLGHGVVIALIVFRTTVAFGRGLVVPFLPFVAESLARRCRSSGSCWRRTSCSPGSCRSRSAGSPTA